MDIKLGDGGEPVRSVGENRGVKCNYHLNARLLAAKNGGRWREDPVRLSTTPLMAESPIAYSVGVKQRISTLAEQ